MHKITTILNNRLLMEFIGVYINGTQYSGKLVEVGLDYITLECKHHNLILMINKIEGIHTEKRGKEDDTKKTPIY